MSTSEPDPERARLDDATSRRLAKLGAAPFDTSKLRKAVNAHIQPPAQDSGQKRRLKLGWLSPMRAMAAGLIVLGVIMALVITSSTGPVLASAERLTHIHEEVLAGTGHSTEVTSFDGAKAALAAKWPDGPAVPELSKDHVVSCCIHMMGHKKIACVSFTTDGVPVTMAVAEAVNIKLPSSETLTVGGISYHVQSHDGINMVMTERDGRWVCLMGKLPVSRLAELAGSLRY